jgi:hypothetical protein
MLGSGHPDPGPPVPSRQAIRVPGQTLLLGTSIEKKDQCAASRFCTGNLEEEFRGVCGWKEERILAFLVH